LPETGSFCDPARERLREKRFILPYLGLSYFDISLLETLCANRNIVTQAYQALEK